MVKAEIDAIFAEEFCQDLLAPVKTAYEDEKAPSARLGNLAYRQMKRHHQRGM